MPAAICPASLSVDEDDACCSGLVLSSLSESVPAAITMSAGSSFDSDAAGLVSDSDSDSDSASDSVFAVFAAKSKLSCSYSSSLPDASSVFVSVVCRLSAARLTLCLVFTLASDLQKSKLSWPYSSASASSALASSAFTVSVSVSSIPDSAFFSVSLKAPGAFVAVSPGVVIPSLIFFLSVSAIPITADEYCLPRRPRTSP